MNRLLRVIGYIQNDKRFLPDKLLTLSSRLFPDEFYIKEKYKLRFGRELNLVEPRSFNEKLNWLKLNYHNPLQPALADKFWAKKIVAKIIGEQYVVPCYGHWKCVDDIDFDKLPERFFLKCNQDSSGGLLVDKNKGFDKIAIKKQFSDKHIRRNWYWGDREWAYKNIEPCILAEEYLDEGTGHELHDYKFWCFNGKPTYMYITNKGAVIRENFYDMDFNPININHGFERTEPEYDKPKMFDKMKELAKRISTGFPFMRVDFFSLNEKLYFGECTFYDWAGMRPFKEYETDEKLGKLIELPII